MTEKELNVSGASGVSTPPAMAMRAPSCLISRKASPIATAPDAQLFVFDMFGPVMPSSMATLQELAPANTDNASMGSTPRSPF
jgi:hypothetical protein